MDLVELKARVYDLLSAQQQIQAELQSVNAEIQKIQRENLAKEKVQKKEK